MTELTREEILAMPAGREMDALIAEYFFNKKFRKPTHGSCCTCQACGWDFDECLCGVSEDISAAFEAIKNEIFDYLEVTIARGLDYWEVVLAGQTAVAEDACLAIWRAALLAVMEK